MKNVLVKDGDLFVVPNSVERAETVVEKIQNLVKNSNASQITINLAGLNMFKALQIASLTCAFGLINNIENKYEFVVDNAVTMAQIELLSLSNLKVRVQEAIKEVKTQRELVVVV